MSLRRGFMLAPYAPQSDIEEALTWGPNIFRYQATTDASNPDIYSLEGYLRWLDTHIMHVDRIVVPTIRGKAVLVFDLHTPPMGLKPQTEQSMRIYRAAWTRLAKQYNNHDVVLVFDLQNEPRGEYDKVNDLMHSCVSIVRTAGNTRTRCAIASYNCDPTRFNKVIPIKVGGPVWYTPHMYIPGDFTHQGVGGRPTGVKYPTLLKGKSYLKRQLASLRKFQVANKAVIFVGEFSASIYGKEEYRAQYISDCIDIFEEYGWHWCYHAWAESPVWNPKTLMVSKVLKNAFKRNEI